MEVFDTSPPPDSKGRRRVSLGFIAGLIAFVFFVVVVTGSVFGWREFFKPDGDEPILLELAFRDAQLMEQLVNESAIRFSEDMRIMALQANLSDAINEEIRIRTEQDALLLRLLLEEIFNRTQKQNALYAGVAQETADRIAGDAAINATLTPIEQRIDAVQEYNDWAAIKFMIVMQNLTDIYDRLQQEIAERVGNETELLAHLALQQMQVTDLQNALAAETAARTAKDMTMMTQVNALLDGEIIFINDAYTLDNKFTFESANAGYTFGVGSPSNVITMSNNWLICINDVYPDNSTSIMTLIPGVNTLIQYNSTNSTIDVSMVNLPVEPNHIIYFGWMVNPNNPGLIGGFPFDTHPLFVHLDAGWMVDFSFFGASNIINNFNTPDTDHWMIPSNMGQSIGTYLMKVQIAIGLYLNALYYGPGSVENNYPSYSFANIAGAVCFSTNLAQCVSGQATLICDNSTCTQGPIEAHGQKAFNNYDSTRWTDVQGGIANGFFVQSNQFPSVLNGFLEPMFVVIDIATVVNGYHFPVGTRAYPMWKVIDTDRQFALSDTFSTSVSITYDITRLQ